MIQAPQHGEQAVGWAIWDRDSPSIAKCAGGRWWRRGVTGRGHPGGRHRSIKHLREASQTDGKAARSLHKLTLFRQFYVLVVSYIYFTRIVVPPYLPPSPPLHTSHRAVVACPVRRGAALHPACCPPQITSRHRCASSPSAEVHS